MFTADDRGRSGARSRLWSAVSTDGVNWQLEGELAGGPGTNLYYSSLADDQLVFLRGDDGDVLRLAMATVEMP